MEAEWGVGMVVYMWELPEKILSNFDLFNYLGQNFSRISLNQIIRDFSLVNEAGSALISIIVTAGTFSTKYKPA